MSDHSLEASGPVKKPLDGSLGGRPDPFWDAAGLTDFYGSIFDCINSIAVLIDTRGVIRMFNRKAVELTGFTKDQALGKDAFMLLFPEVLRDQARSLLLGTTEGYGEATNLSAPVVDGSGRPVPVSWDVSTVKDDHGGVFGTVCIGHVLPDLGTAAGPSQDFSSAACMCAKQLVHDILNHNQVAIGYLELAMEQSKPGNELRSMLDEVYKALLRSSDLAVDVYRTSRSAPYTCCYSIQMRRQSGK